MIGTLDMYAKIPPPPGNVCVLFSHDVLTLYTLVEVFRFDI